jgi:uncharacterized glyoxalase superfamily metalloenzyme YdcJ
MPLHAASLHHNPKYFYDSFLVLQQRKFYHVQKQARADKTERHRVFPRYSTASLAGTLFILRENQAFI